MNSYNPKLCRYHVQSKISLPLLQLLMNNKVQFVYFFGLALFSAVIYERRGEKLISKTIKYKLGSSSKMQFAFFYPKDIQNFFLQNYQFCRKSENKAESWGRGFIFFTSLYCNAYENRYVIPLLA